MGTVTIFAGRGGEGKSTYSLHLAAKVTHGDLAGEFARKPSTVLLVGHEDDLETVVMPRLIAAGADPEMVYSVTIRTSLEGVDFNEVPSITEDLARIREAIVETGAKLIIVDPLTSMMGDSNLDKTADVRRALNPFAALASELDIAIVAIMHFRKGQGDTRDMLSGSHAFRDAARSVIIFATDEESQQRIATVDKSNYSIARGESFAFNLLSTEVDTGDGEVATVARIHDLGASTISVSDIVNRQPDKALGEEIARVVECVTSHPEGVKPAVVADETGMAANAVRSYLIRAEERGLIIKPAYGIYFPKATVSQSSTPDALVASVALHREVLLSATTATGTTGNTGSANVALKVRGVCPACGNPSDWPNREFGYLHPACSLEEVSA